VILSNSNFTSRVYARSFPSLAKRKPKVVYPCIDVSAYKVVDRKGKGKQATDIDEGVSLIAS
jgi:alpha-1,3/alpha-1,6-mannosyltransferase